MTHFNFKKWTLTTRQRCDLEMLLMGAFSPLTGFLSQADYNAVIMNMHLTTGHLWPMPITLDVSEAFANQVSINDEISLCDSDNTVLARMTISDKWIPDKNLEAEKVFTTQDIKHPGVHYFFNQVEKWYLGGPVQIERMPAHHDFPLLYHTPQALKKLFLQLGWGKIVGFQTRNPIHRAHMALTLRAMEQISGHLLLHPVVGMTKPGDIDYLTRVKCYQKILPYYPDNKAMLSLLPLAMRMAGPREALWHALIRKNYGCTHFIVGRDHAGPGNNTQNQPFYEPYAAQNLALQYEKEMGITILPFQEMVYIKERQSYLPLNQVKPEETALTISGTELRKRLIMDQSIPNWFSFPEIIQVLRDSYPPRHQKGFTLFFTGLSGSGKSTIAQALMIELMRHQKRSISILDGDLVRQLLADKLGFSQADRNLNIRIISYIAAEITKAGGIAICAAIAPYQTARDDSRTLISKEGGFIEIYNATPLTTCEQRDTKGLYARARAGELKNLTGVDDVYEAPSHPDIVMDTSALSVDDCVNKIIDFLHHNGYLKIERTRFEEKTHNEAITS